MLSLNSGTGTNGGALGVPPFIASAIWSHPGRFQNGIQIPGELKEALEEIERLEGVVICLASGTSKPLSGGRTRVDFIFVRHPEWYVSVHGSGAGARLAIELEDFDLRGWDIRDALTLFSQSSPEMFRCLRSPVVYEEKLSFAPRLRSLMSTFFEANVFFSYHYSQLCDRVANLTKSRGTANKSSIHIVKPLLSLLWIERDLGPIPEDTLLLAEEVIQDPELRHAILGLVGHRSGEDAPSRSGIKLIDRFVSKELKRFEFVDRQRRRFGVDGTGASEDARQFHPLLDQVFRETVSEAVAYESSTPERLGLFAGARAAERLLRGKRTLLDLIQEYAILCEAKTHHGGMLPPVADRRWQKMRNFYELLMGQHGESDRPAAVYTAHDIKSRIWSRRVLRVRTDESVSVQTDRDALSGQLADVSRGGGLVQCDQALVPGSSVGVDWPVVGDEGGGALEAEVVWVAGHPAVTRRPKYRMGVRFVDLPPSRDLELDRLVVDRLGSKLAGLGCEMLDPDFVEEEHLLVKRA